ncbi:pyridoxal 5'-phosphate synthase, glutaminase subunit Pdx2 [Geoglobus ahangari]|uniref:Pyridoxal 5'-phosphate synthase subunit PdxT n=1 Tax=Geoglobus ahangari TaxID=113653 RepID=A0A0F7IH14_9EURY|nr:pyridoxal 5'-phosphate synthase glutaminase subunit PdxT [Geoglobus ahangari]AKG92597.1 pyridoxal 5'-phosphate synthase, glutaminase subunit Pdx2 [Geoglobus ahangari]
MRVAVVGVQGDVEEHVEITRKAMERLGLDGEVVATRKSGVVSGSDAVILPGGESTTISKLIWRDGIAEEILELARDGRPVMGTCAGLIVLAKHGDEQVEKTRTKLLGLLDVKVKRNAFGRQRESFEAELDFKGIGRYNAVFIRAPAVEWVGEGVEVLARFEDKIVAVRQKNVIGLAFHPELTEDTRIHKFFLSLI